MLTTELIDQINHLSEAEQNWIAEQIKKLLNHEISIHTNGETEEGENDYILPAGALYPYKANYEIEDIKNIIAQFPARKKWTFTDLQDERIFPIELKIKLEIINNQIYIMPKPTLTHQEIAVNITTFINVFVKTNKLGKVYAPPVSVKLDENNVVEPDVLVILMSKIEMISTDKAIEGVPNLVVEVISKANYKKLREAKKKLYAEFGVEEYWEVYPKKKFARIATLQTDEEGQKSYTTYSEAGKDGIIKSSVLNGFELPLHQIFE